MLISEYLKAHEEVLDELLLRQIKCQDLVTYLKIKREINLLLLFTESIKECVEKNEFSFDNDIHNISSILYSFLLSVTNYKIKSRLGKDEDRNSFLLYVNNKLMPYCDEVGIKEILKGALG